MGQLGYDAGGGGEFPTGKIFTVVYSRIEIVE
jgi:hypothetical protein